MDENYTKEQLIIIALKQRIAALTEMYEWQLAELRADLTILSRVSDIAKGNVELSGAPSVRS